MRMDTHITKKKVAIITNNVHCERHVQYYSTIEKYFKMNGWEVSEDFDVNKIVICSCGFHDAMYEKILRTLDKLKAIYFPAKDIILLGCLTKTHQEVLSQCFKGKNIAIREEKQLDDLIKAKIPFSQVQEVNVYNLPKSCAHSQAAKTEPFFHIKISQGCLRNCTFCVINKAKGYIRSVPEEEIINQFREALSKGFKKVFLMGEDTFAYGVDQGTTIIELLNKLYQINQDVDIYFGYLHIRWLNAYAVEINDLCKKGKIKELHIGLQHVNEEILNRMGRPVVFSDTYGIIRSIKRDCPEIYLVADIMVGFPGETTEQFNELMGFFRHDNCFNKVKHFGYSDVKGSVSSGFSGKVPAAEITRRFEELNTLLGNRSYNDDNDENRLDNETFRLTRFEDYFFCKDTFIMDEDEKVEKGQWEMATPGIQDEDVEGFDF